MRGFPGPDGIGRAPDAVRPEASSESRGTPRAHADLVPVLAMVAVLVATYGYETFSFSLTMDEPVLGRLGQRALLNTWSAGGRWGMGLVSAVLPPMVVPGVAAALGVGLTAAGIWLLARRVHGLSPWQSSALTALCASLPMILLHLSFMTNAVGIGLGFLLTSLVAQRVDRQRRLVDVAAVAMATFVLAVYEAFGIVLLAVALGLLVRRPDAASARRWAVLLGGSFVLTKLVGFGIRSALGVGSSDYSSSMLDIRGLATTPWERVVHGGRRAYGVLMPGGGVFERGAPWLALLLVALVCLSIGCVAVQPGPRNRRIGQWAALASLLAVPWAAGILVVDLPLRSMLYLPAVIVSLAALVLTTDRVTVVLRRRWPVIALVAVLGLAVVANVSVGNRALGSAELALNRDRYIAMRIDEERRLLLPEETGAVPMYVTPVERWPDSTLNPGLEHLGLSLFSGEPWRATSFLGSQGVPVTTLSPEQAASAIELAAGMPIYPQPGWARVDDGVLVVRLR